MVCFPLLPCCTRSGKQIAKKDLTENSDSMKKYSWNRDFLGRHVEIIELKHGKSSLVLVPAWQGRVMTSTSEGDDGLSFGWINHSLISSGKIQPHINPYGGEERLWLGPEGGQFSIFFPEGKDFIFDNWQTPAIIDTEPFKVKERNDTSVTFTADTEIKNYSGFVFSAGIERTVTVITDKVPEGFSPAAGSSLNVVAYRSVNKLTNTGTTKWKKETGLLSVWMLGMFNPSPAVTVVIPVRESGSSGSGPKVNDKYFGAIAPDRLKVTGSHVFFKADGRSRGKIGIPPLRTTGVMGSYDSENNVLTLLFCNLPENVTDYVNSAWELQKYPYSGDAYNSYNDGPLEDGTQMGPFYELETSSPAAGLAPGESIIHAQTTVHITGSRKNIDDVARRILGVGLDAIERVFR